MKFVCERCQTRYSIADEKVRQKILKIRCKTCENVIEVRESISAPGPAPAGIASSVAAFAASSAASAAGARSPTRSHAAAAPPPAAPGGPAVREWHIAINGEQDGPFSRPDLVRRIFAARKDDEVYIWREDFDRWKEPKEFPAIERELAALSAQAAGQAASSAVPRQTGSRPVPGLPAPTGRSVPMAAKGAGAAGLAPGGGLEERTQIAPVDASLMEPDSGAG